MHVAFLLHDSQPLDQLARLDPDADWREFVTGERAWILQAFLRLRVCGADVSLTDRVPADGIVVFSAKQKRFVQRACRRTGALLIGVREDVGEALIADLEIVQNEAQADDRRRFFIPHWSQPALRPRDPARGTQIRTLAFKGFLGNLHPGFREEPWLSWLAQRALQWTADAAPYRRNAVDTSALEWNDYSTVDLVVAVRAPDPRLHPRKPATKLYNAWLAGVPALLGPESAYRALRRSALDYLEVATAHEAIAAIDRLRSDPQLYRAMVDNGRERAVEFKTEAHIARWQRLLFEVAPRHLQRAGVRRWRGRSLRAKDLSRRILRALGLWR